MKSDSDGYCINCRWAQLKKAKIAIINPATKYVLPAAAERSAGIQKID